MEEGTNGEGNDGRITSSSIARERERDARARRRREGDDLNLARVPTHRSLREGNEIFIGLAGRGWCDES